MEHKIILINTSFYLALDQVFVALAVNLLVLEEDTATLAGAHEVVVTVAGGQAAAHGGPRSLAVLTPL